MTNAEKYTDIIKYQGIKHVTMYLFYGTELVHEQVFDCEKEAEQFGEDVSELVSESVKPVIFCPNGLPFEGVTEDGYRFTLIYKWH